MHHDDERFAEIRETAAPSSDQRTRDGLNKFFWRSLHVSPDVWSDEADHEWFLVMEDESAFDAVQSINFK